jgi:hypothetical protein
MDTASNSEKIFIGIGNERIELIGTEKDDFLAQLQLDNAEQQAIQEAKETAETERATKLASAITKLKALGLTEEEAKIIIGLE